MFFEAYDLFAGGSPDYAADAARLERERQEKITRGTTSINKAFGGFNDAFYNQRAKAYYDFAYPQLAEQYRQTQAQTGFGLANRGLQQSQAANRKWSDVYQTYQKGQQSIADVGITQAQALKNQVETARNNLISLLYQSADPSQASQQAVSTAAGFSYPSVWPSISNQFSKITDAAYMAAVLNAYRQPMYTPGGDGGSFSLAGLPPSTISTSTNK